MRLWHISVLTLARSTSSFTPGPSVKKTLDEYMITSVYCTLMYLTDVSGGDDKPSWLHVTELASCASC